MRTLFKIGRFAFFVGIWLVILRPMERLSLIQENFISPIDIIMLFLKIDSSNSRGCGWSGKLFFSL
jgi:hypothetical protein